jgi:phage repressor protein C with HTH and peptisase S24 domain
MFDLMQIAVDDSLLDNTNSMGTGENSEMYDALLALKPNGMTLNAWTVKAGVGRSIFTEIRRHGNPTAETLQKLLDAIGVSLGELYAQMPPAPVRSEVRGTGLVSEKDVHDARWGLGNLPAVPLVGSAVGGASDDLDEHVELTELHLGEVLDYLARPAGLANDPGAYAVTVVGDSMVPRYKPGERCFVSPRSSVGIGDDVIVQLRGNGDAAGADPDFSSRVTMVLVKELVRRGATFIELKQHNPDMTFKVPMARVAAVHRISGRL